MTLREIAEKIGGRLTGNGDLPITGISGIEEAREGDITFLAAPKFVRHLNDCRASAIIIGNKLAHLAGPDRNLITVENPILAYAHAARLLAPSKTREPVVSSLAFVSPDASLAPTVAVYPYVFIDRDVTIEDDVTLFPFVYVGPKVRIGRSSTLYPNVTLYGGTIIGRNVTVHAGTVIGSDGFAYVWDGKEHVKIPQLGNVEIEDDVEIGADVTIDRASLGTTLIRRGTKIDNLVQVAHNVTIGEDSIIVSQVGIAGSSSLGRNVVLAGQVGVRDHVAIGDNVQVAGQTGISADVPSNTAIAGTPHMPYKDWLKLQAYIKRLPQLFERMKKVEDTLDREGNND
jgi:UDP-3-O-[3-hydroxymyristoyl] glucosamine N-acyltransferase